MPEVFNLSPNLINRFRIMLLSSNTAISLLSVKNNQNKRQEFWINSRGHEVKLLQTLLILESSEIASHREPGESNRAETAFGTYRALEEGEVLK